MNVKFYYDNLKFNPRITGDDILKEKKINNDIFIQSKICAFWGEAIFFNV